MTGPAEELLTPDEIMLEDHEDDPRSTSDEDGHLENDDYRREHPDA